MAVRGHPGRWLLKRECISATALQSISRLKGGCGRQAERSRGSILRTGYSPCPGHLAFRSKRSTLLVKRPVGHGESSI